MQQQTEALKITQNETPARTRVTVAETREERRRFIRENLLLSPEEAGEVLGVSGRTVIDWWKDTKNRRGEEERECPEEGGHGLVLVDDRVRREGKLSAGARFTASSVEVCRRLRQASPDNLKE
jgi:hypothetical protein